MRVCILAPIHRWNDVRVYEKQAKSLEGEGFSVSIICNCSHPYCVSGIDFIPSILTGKSKLLRLFLSPFLFIQCLRVKADIYHCHNPDTIITAFILKLLRKIVIYDTHEDFSLRVLFKSWIPKPIRKPLSVIISKAESILSYTVDHTFITQTNMLNRFSDKTTVLANLPIPPKGEIELNRKNKDGILRLVYLGLINEHRGIFDIVRSLFICNEEMKINVRLYLIGDVESSIFSKLKEESGWMYVDYISFLPQQLAFDKIKQSDVGLIYIHDVGDHRYTDPNKIYEYMMHGKPFIASDFDEWKTKFNSGCGWFVQPKRPDKLASLIEDVYMSDQDDLLIRGRNGLGFVKVNNWNDEKRKLLDVYKKIL